MRAAFAAAIFLCCHAAEFETPYNIDTPLRSRVRGVHNGSTARLFVVDFSLEYWKSKAALFRNLTGADIIVTGAVHAKWKSDIFEDLTGAGVFDGYLMDAAGMPELASRGLILDLSDRLKADMTTNWLDIFPTTRNVASYDNSIFVVPMDGDVVMMTFREDLLDAQNFSVPKSWDDFLRVASAFNGTDLNGDGTPDFGACFSTARGDIGHNMFWAVLAPYLQSKGSEEGAFFDPETFSPKFDGPEFLEGLEMHKKLVEVSPYWEKGQTGWGETLEIFNEGRCALFFNYPGPTKMAISAQKDSGLSGKLQVAPLPGRRCEKGCKFSTDGVNFAPFFATGGQGGIINAASGKKQQDIIYDFFSYIIDPETSWFEVADPGSLLDPYRTSQIFSLDDPDSKETEAFKHFGWEQRQLPVLKKATTFMFDHPNGVKDLSILGTMEYIHDATMPALEAFMKGAISAKQAAENLVNDWNDVTSKYQLAGQRDMYRLSLGLAPYVDVGYFEGQETNTLTILFVSLGCALVIIPSVILLIRKYGKIQGNFFSSLAVEIGMRFTRFTVDGADLATDVVTCWDVVNTPRLWQYHGIYVAGTALAVVVGGIGIVFQACLMKKAYTDAKRLEDSDDLVRAHENDKQAKAAEIKRDITTAWFTLLIFVLEDLVMITFNLVIILNTGLKYNDDGSVQIYDVSGMMAASLAVNFLVAGYKISTLKRLKDLYALKHQVVKDVGIVSYLSQQASSRSTQGAASEADVDNTSGLLGTLGGTVKASTASVGGAMTGAAIFAATL